MGTQEVKLERAGEKSAVDCSDPVCLFIHNNIIHNNIIINHIIIRPKSSGRVTHDSHKLQTKAIHHSTRHYMNRRELESDQPHSCTVCCVYSAFLPRLPSVHCRHSQAARATPSNHPQGCTSNCAIRIYRQKRYRDDLLIASAWTLSHVT